VSGSRSRWFGWPAHRGDRVGLAASRGLPSSSTEVAALDSPSSPSVRHVHRGVRGGLAARWFGRPRHRGGLASLAAPAVKSPRPPRWSGRPRCRGHGPVFPSHPVRLASGHRGVRHPDLVPASTTEVFVAVPWCRHRPPKCSLPFPGADTDHRSVRCRTEVPDVVAPKCSSSDHRGVRCRGTEVLVTDAR
jgi:hypothetical protein